MIEDPSSEKQTIKLDCGHQFHENCLIPWFETQISNGHKSDCPLCRQNIECQKHRK